MNECYKKILFLDFRKEFIDVAKYRLNHKIISNPFPGAYDIVAIDESGGILETNNIKANFVLCPHTSPFRGKIICSNVISCGMSSKSTFGLSSTNKKHSMFSLNRAINMENYLILPFEEPFILDERLSLYENIIIYGIEMLSNRNQISQYSIEKSYNI